MNPNKGLDGMGNWLREHGWRHEEPLNKGVRVLMTTVRHGDQVFPDATGWDIRPDGRLVVMNASIEALAVFAAGFWAAVRMEE